MHKTSFRIARSPKISFRLYDDDMSTTSSRKTSGGEGLWISDGEERNFVEEVNPQLHARTTIEKLRLLGRQNLCYEPLPEVFEPETPEKIYPELPKFDEPIARDANDNVKPILDHSVSFSYHFIPVEVQTKVDPQLPFHKSPSATTIDAANSILLEEKIKKEKKVRISIEKEESTPLISVALLPNAILGGSASSA
ncbi:hypothetical protein WR25_06027 [Diploscapter pachys]|uniref:Uncharacterized protein n=1 Tax=Diploscapter pachys TaxID=2018661 RepID=A0A2A2LQF0_9BILA|nr:hypothetical protein WR25_06027 [Diploscapter pachys]